uniref:M protein repeat protein n=1 Tax=Macrostomum lignano TaxID=282301 RepID=A0A1I8FKF6_9PLAT
MSAFEGLEQLKKKVQAMRTEPIRKNELDREKAKLKEERQKSAAYQSDVDELQRRLTKLESDKATAEDRLATIESRLAEESARAETAERLRLDTEKSGVEREERQEELTKRLKDDAQAQSRRERPGSRPRAGIPTAEFEAADLESENSASIQQLRSLEQQERAAMERETNSTRRPIGSSRFLAENRATLQLAEKECLKKNKEMDKIRNEIARDQQLIDSLEKRKLRRGERHVTVDLQQLVPVPREVRPQPDPGAAATGKLHSDGDGVRLADLALIEQDLDQAAGRGVTG